MEYGWDHRLHGVGTLVDDDPTVADFTFRSGMETHGAGAPVGAETKQEWPGWSRPSYHHDEAR